MKPSVDKTVQDLLNRFLGKLEEHFESDIFSYFGPVADGNENTILKLIEEIADEGKYKRLTIFLTTYGGSALAVERFVNIIRSLYKEIYFVVPDYAYSAGTIFCMSGDKIFMDYFSVLGPIDPQVQNKDGKWVPALGYLDKINELIDKAKKNELTNAEFLILKDFDLAELRGYEQARELTFSLLKKWLVKYKFKNWKTHRSNKEKKGEKVTIAEKRERAEEIATKLSDNNLWKSHSRPINIETLTNDIRLEIEDYSDEDELRKDIRSYYDLLSDYVKRSQTTIFIHTRKFI
ncbi:MAG: serine dehydrogenasease [Candidatus Paceibacterota bacterium]